MYGHKRDGGYEEGRECSWNDAREAKKDIERERERGKERERKRERKREKEREKKREERNRLTSERGLLELKSTLFD